VHIPLDYYRILGLPIQATTDQLRQAHRDRTVQLPRREYSEAAIASRKYLLDEAYALLADPGQRRAYDNNFLAKTYELDMDPVNPDTPADANTPSIEVPDPHLVGALLILQELGEYELVLRLGRPFLTGGSASLKDGQFGNPNVIYADIVLTVALACLELGREQWQQGQYENAAEALETGQQLLLREGFFAGVRGEIQGDLYKLRPYRILELLALPERQASERKQGLLLLQDMLTDRNGIDGSGNDHSGLSMDDFLRFVQQLRSYVTAAEQQAVFEEEAQRPSAVATYLAVYALLARGFADRQPALVRRAKALLLRLSSRQDVHLEQSVCALLLGQTEEASRALELSQEYEPIAFIREQSQGSPDLLPGLCLYAEHWLREEVFPHFRDLSQRRVSLKDYFADPDVQLYLEELPNEPTVAPADWSAAQAQERAYAAAARSSSRSPMPIDRRQPVMAGVGRGGAGDRPLDISDSGHSDYDPPEVDYPESNRPEDTDALIELAKSRVMGAGIAAGAVATAASVGAMADGLANTTGEVRPLARRSSRTTTPPTARSAGTASLRNGTSGTAVLSHPGEQPPLDRPGTSRSRRTPATSLWGFRLLRIGSILLALILMGLGFSYILKSCQPSNSADTAHTSSSPTVEPSPAVSPSAPADPTTVAVVDTASAEQMLKLWLDTKSAAMGPDYTTTGLAKILAEPKLSYWQESVAEAKRDNWHKKYQHNVRVSSVQVSPESADRAEVIAQIDEAEEIYTGGVLAKSSPAETLSWRYSFVRKDGAWHIADWRAE
jgi:hypothetical protein